MPDLYTIGNDQTIRAAETAAYAKAGGFSGSALVTALAIARAESGWNYGAKGGPNSNGTYDWGLFQINDVNKPTDAEKTQPLENSRKAFAVYRAAGNSFKPWSTYNSGSYKQYIPAAQAAVAELNKRGAQFEKDALAKNGSAVMSPGQLETAGPQIPDPFAGLGKTFSDATNKIGSFFNLSLGVVVGVVLLALGIILLSRGFVGKVVTGTLTDMAKKPAPKAVKPTLSVEERARKSLDYSATRKRLQNEDMRIAADAARAKLRRI